MSSGLLVLVMLPWVNCWATAATLEPMPTWVADAPPASELAKTSANCAFELLKPTMLALATLLPITSRSLEAEFRPLSPG